MSEKKLISNDIQCIRTAIAQQYLPIFDAF